MVVVVEIMNVLVWPKSILNMCWYNTTTIIWFIIPLQCRACVAGRMGMRLLEWDPALESRGRPVL